MNKATSTAKEVSQVLLAIVLMVSAIYVLATVEPKKEEPEQENIPTVQEADTYDMINEINGLEDGMTVTMIVKDSTGNVDLFILDSSGELILIESNIEIKK